jgi:hypothetical protein
MKKSKQAVSTRTQVLRHAKELGVDVLDHENTLWLFCPAGKVFDFGDAEYHYRFYEYGKNRSKFMRKALENMHPQFELQFFPSPKTEVYAEMLENLRVNAPTDCTEPECELCRFRRTLPSTSESLVKLAQFFLNNDYSY